tara:strand:+ start:71 stop:538 length:468 start_codon:yes stop_codon:yes gene_type:complete
MIKTLDENRLGLLVWKVSNFWHNSLKRYLKKHSLTVNEYIVLESIYRLQNNQININQIALSNYSGVDISVISVVLKLLEKKSLVTRNIDLDNRKKIINLTNKAILKIKEILPSIDEVEKNIFNKLDKEKTNFYNTLKIILGKKIRIKAERSINDN